MLAIRFLRSGRTNKAFFRIVLTESSRPPKSGFLKVLGWYDPHTKENSLDKEAILGWLDKGAQASNLVAKLLNNNGIKHKSATFSPDKEKAKKSKDEPKAAPAAKKEESETEATETEEPVVEAEAEVAEAPQAEEVAEEAKTEDQAN